MKTLKFIFLIAPILFSCQSKVAEKTPKAKFGIYETVRITDIPGNITDTLKALNIQLEKDTGLSTVGYISKSDTQNLIVNYPNEGIQLIKTTYSVDDDGKYIALVAVKKNPVITNSEIHKAIADGNRVEIHFNMDGAKKFAETTKNNIGRQLAFAINDKVYSMPLVNDEIKCGIAVITTLENSDTAKKLAASLN